MIFERKKYLDELIAGRGNGLVKIITQVSDDMESLSNCTVETIFVYLYKRNTMVMEYKINH